MTDAFAAVAILDAKVPFQYGSGIRGYDRYRQWKKKKTFNDQRDDKEKQQWVLQQRNAEKAYISLKACF